MLILPGLIDIHVHLRDPGQTEKEDFYTGTSAALAGGFTTVVDMPNNKIPITTLERLEEKIKIAKEKIICDIGFYFGSAGDNINEFNKIKGKVCGLKLYLNPTTGNLLISEKELNEVFKNWFSDLPILVHAEDEKVEAVLYAVKKYGKRTHFCHMSSIDELEPVIKAKEDGLPVTCGVTPHHLFLTEDDLLSLKSFRMMKPSLKTKKDREFLWKKIKYIDVIESDHAPHTLSEKESGNPPFGVPGLETTLPLLITAEKEGKITREKILQMCFFNPVKILNIQTDKTTKVEVDEDCEYEIKGKDIQAKCRWTPFEGWKVKGKVKRVFIRGEKVFEEGNVIAKPGFGRII